jgi:hypothetical protein
MSFLVLAGRFVTRKQSAEPVTLYLALAAALIILGIGSVRGRRWARDLTLIGSAYVLAFTLLGAPFVVWMVSRFLAREPSLSGQGASFGCAVLGPLVFILLLLALVPLAFLFFYARRDVRATVERLDPDPGWTDRQPLPLLAAALFFAAGAVGWLPALFSPVVPVPGAILTGNTARALVFALGLGCAVVAWGLYRGLRGAWVAALVLSVAGTVFWLWTLRDIDVQALQRAMGATEEELAVMRKIDLRPGLLALTAAGAAAWTAFLIWVRKYLTRNPLVSR